VITTKSVFYYIESVDDSNFYLDFDEGAGELSAIVQTGDYTPQDFVLVVQSAMNEIGNQSYTITLDRDTRRVTISASSNFDLLILTGTHVGNDIFSLLGFTGGDLTGLNSYTGEPIGEEYRPQFLLQDYVDQEDLREAVQAVKNESASGVVETVFFGIRKKFEFNIQFITDIEQGKGSVVETNLNGVQSARLFMRYLITARPLEFMPDRNNTTIFYKILLDSTEESSNGTGYRLKELYTKNLPFYYETGKLVFRLVEV